MPRRRWRLLGRREALSEARRHYLKTGDALLGDGFADLDLFLTAKNAEQVRQWWLDHRDEILPEFIRAHPGCRPFAWWRFDAPEPRRRLGGIGTPAHELLAYAPNLRFGIPARWVEPSDVAYYNGLAVDINGRPIGTEYRPGHFRGRAIDPDNPPRFESEAAYLDRLNLLMPEERAALPHAGRSRRQ